VGRVFTTEWPSDPIKWCYPVMIALVSIMLVVCLMTIYRHRRAQEFQKIRALERKKASRTRFLPDGGDSSGDVASSRWNDQRLKLAFRPGPVDVPG
jgi:hypothetical protein